MNAYPAQYQEDAEERELVAEWLARDTDEGMTQYERIFASMLGLKAWEDLPDAERMRIYLSNPPVVLPGSVLQLVFGLQPMQPPPDSPGKYPQWFALAFGDVSPAGEQRPADAEFYEAQVEDYMRLRGRWLSGELVL
jgi:hypothetical protein